MGSTQETHVMREQQPHRGGIRVVILEPSPETRSMLQVGLDELKGFDLVGTSETWNDCLALLSAYVPELLITRVGLMPRFFGESLGDAVFPVTVGLRRQDGSGTLEGGFETIDMSDPQSLRAAMERVRTEIYRRKLDELSVLLRQYMRFSCGIQRYLTAVAVDDSGAREIPAECVTFMAAYGNYVRVHAGADVHEVRDTMSGMTSKLDPAQFARVHRSFIVNRAHVASVRRKEGAAVCVLLSNGTEIPVGPNYRTEVDSFDATGNRLSA
jgi:two-component system, LytTR family, response regulator